jgi:predicted Zn finger-like uncharacterized protein
VQGSCPQCSSKIAIDDAKVPDRAFQVKCPKCGNLVRFPGRAPEPSAASATDGPAEAPAASAASGEDEVRAQMMAQVRREMSLSEGIGGGGRALVNLGDKGHAGAITLTLSRQGYQVDSSDDSGDSSRLIEQGVYDLVVTARIAGSVAKGESLYQRLNRLNPDSRRRLFVVLVGDEFKTADGTQAWSCLADLVVSAKDAGSADAAIRNVVQERQRLIQAYVDARRRHEAAEN